MLWPRVFGLRYNHRRQQGSPFRSSPSTYRRFLYHTNMDLSEILNPLPDNEADPNDTQSRHASATGSSNDGLSLSRPSLNLANQSRRGYAPILPASALTTAVVNIKPRSLATLNNGLESSTAGPNSREWNPNDHPKICEYLAFATQNGMHR